MLINLNITEFANEVASAKSVMPGGGCVAALSGLMGVCLMEMSIKLLHGCLNDKQLEMINKLQTELKLIHDEMLDYIDKDAAAYNRVITASNLKNTIGEENKSLPVAKELAILEATDVPLRIGNACLNALECSKKFIKMVKPSVVGDLKVGLLVTKASAEGAFITAKINTSMVKDESMANKLLVRINKQQVKLDGILSDLL